MSHVALRTVPDVVVGRDEQLAALAETFEVVRRGRSMTVLLGGDAGVGKTTLVNAFVATLSVSRVVRGQCVPLGGDGLAFAPIIGALRDLEGQVGDETLLRWAGPGAASLGTMLPELAGQTDPDDDHLRLFEAVTEILERAAEAQPLVVVLEDVHWADASTRHLVAFVIRALTDARVMVIATYRSDELHRRHPLRPFLAEMQRLNGVISHAVPRLDSDGVATMLTALRDDRPDAAFVEEVFRRSDGIPFFVEELARTDCCDLPAGLRDVLIVRFESLDRSAQAAVRLVAVAGYRVEYELFSRSSDLDEAELDVGLREAVDAQLLIVDGSGFRFRHALLREAVLEDLLPGEATTLHRRIAEAIEAAPTLVPEGTSAVELAHHWFAARDVDKAFSWSLAAARDRPIDKSESLRMLERALDLWDDVDGAQTVAGQSHAELLESTADVAVDAGELTRALALVEATRGEVDAATRPLDAARLLQAKGHLLSKLNRFGSVEVLEQAVDLVPATPPTAQRADVLGMFAAMKMMAGDGNGAITAARESIEAAVAAAAKVPEATARITLATCIGSVGRMDEAREEFAHALALAEGVDERTIMRHHINLSDVLRLNGHFREATITAEGGIEIARQLGLRRTWSAILAGNAAEPLLLLGEWDRARRLIDRALDLDPPALHRIHLKTLLALHQVWTDDLAAADRTLAEFRQQLSSAQPIPQYLTMIALSASEFALAVGDPGRAWAAAKVSGDRRETQNAGAVWWVARAGAEAISLARRDERVPFDVAAAEDYIRRAIDELEVAAPLPAGRAVIEAELVDEVAAWDVAIAALEQAEGPVHLLAHAHLRRAELLADDRRAAGDALRAAEHIASGIGARLLQRRIADLRRRLGVRTGEGPPADGQPSPLTPREREVLRLVARGKTNGEIGNELFISTKTASVHVSNILAKLGVSSRTEAAAVALRELQIDHGP
jgi:DNA-binding CsgD family transcriptional regulator/tetratricopeptide (TPR) repeat protein